MLRITPQASASAAKNYYSKADYYAEGQEITGRWGGKAADKLGLSGTVDQHAFDALCDNLDPATGQQLTQRLKAERRAGYDFTFDVPKSVSVLYALTEDPAVLEAFRAAVRATMTEIETEMKARVRKGGVAEDRLTGNLVYAEFVHFTSRPAKEDGLPDPHLHAHAFVPNVTYDPVERIWKAGQFGDLKRDAPYYEAAFHARVAARLTDLGYAVERRGKTWELAGVPSGVVRKFSRRTEEIESLARERGITDPHAKAELGALSRQGKRRELTREQLRLAWDNRLTDGERQALRRVQDRQVAAGPRVSAVDALRHATAHVFERQSVVPEKTLLAEALRYGVGSVQVEQVAREMTSQGVVTADYEGRRLATTRAVLQEEAAMLTFARDGKGTRAPLGKPNHAFTREWLNDGQRAAVRHILESPDRVMVIRGAAGVGKTSLMQEAVEAIEQNGKRVYAFAPSAEASRGVLHAEGFARATTVAELLVNKELQQELRGQVLWIDEAGQLGTRDLARVFQLAREQGTRVLLTGDKRQHASVARGDALRLLEEQAGLPVAEVVDIQRQQGAYKAAVGDLARGRVQEGFAKLDELGWVLEVPDQERHARLAADYVEAAVLGKSALVVSPTHAEGAKITAAIRARLRQRGYLGEEEHTFLRLESRDLTEAQRRDAASYQAGDVLQFHQNALGHRRGKRLTVAEDARNVPLQHAGRFQVYQATSLRLAAGDTIRVTANGTTKDKKHRLHNGALYQVAGFTKDGDLTLRNGWTIAKDYGHIAPGYVTTSHASQGKTVDRVFIGQGSESLPAASREQLYVSVSRAREKAVIYTDDKTALRQAVARSGERLSATELLGPQERRGKLLRHVELFQRLAEQARALAGSAVDKLRSTMRQPQPAKGAARGR